MPKKHLASGKRSIFAVAGLLHGSRASQVVHARPSSSRDACCHLRSPTIVVTRPCLTTHSISLRVRVDSIVLYCFVDSLVCKGSQKHVRAKFSAQMMGIEWKWCSPSRNHDIGYPTHDPQPRAGLPTPLLQEHVVWKPIVSEPACCLLIA